jgi:ABC-type spermidine/putrescine transport system permease subunit II
MLLDLLTVAVLAFVGSRLVQANRLARTGPARARALQLVRGVRARHVLLALPVLLAVIVAFAALDQVPGLSFGWYSAIGGEGNPVFGASEHTTGTALEILVPVVFIALLLPALPLLVEREEQIFRVGSERRSTRERLERGLAFGLVHAIIGIPLAAALALSVGGWYLTWAYLRGYRDGGPAAALLESTRSHLAYNAVVIAAVVAALAVAAVGGG